MIYAVSPSGEVFEVRGGGFAIYKDRVVEVYDCEGGEKLRIFPAGYYITCYPPYPSLSKYDMISEDVIKFVRECSPPIVAKLKRELRKFNAQSLSWQD